MIEALILYLFICFSSLYSQKILETYEHLLPSILELLSTTEAWAERMRKEWRILEESLPETIFVRAYESRMDLLRAVIIGAKGTPYQDGLFFFDVYFPPTYPLKPPLVRYHSGGLAINPHLLECGEVRLNLFRSYNYKSWTLMLIGRACKSLMVWITGRASRYGMTLIQP
ncbi:putative ubiquitin-conjugating enzyme E2, ubiquitin-conjugating enzyme/RWD [Helianthus anomalus]